MRAGPRISWRLVATAVLWFTALAALAILVFVMAAASALEHASPGTLVVVAAGLAVTVLAAVGLAQRVARRADFDWELRQLLEEEAGKAP